MKSAHNKHAHSSRRHWIYERHNEPLLSFEAFLMRCAAHGGLAVVLVIVLLGVGAMGYKLTEGMRWIDAFLNASMILSGMGPVSQLHSSGGKIFATFYALFSGVVFLVAVGIFFAPLLHRILHRLHLDEDGTS